MSSQGGYSNDQGKESGKIDSSTSGGSSNTQQKGDPNHRGKAPGVRCKVCAEKGKVQWVFSGRDCPYCGTYAP
ncbi:hypothetical protein GGR53DRAFT_467273 [Hypoxylon sp. FL1150]|nr:hypothetical protein GGR53DRAFT_467273 [Hypoxylon sp. FL1150]